MELRVKIFRVQRPRQRLFQEALEAALQNSGTTTLFVGAVYVPSSNSS